MAYLPKSKYQQKYTNGDEFVVVSTGRPYVGDYLELSNKTYFAGKSPQTITVELKPVISTSNNVPYSISNRKFEILNPSYVNKERKYTTPVATKIFPTESDYNRGFFTRYFIFRLIKNDYIEVDQKTYNECLAGDIIDKSLYITGKIRWAITGEINTINTNSLIILEQTFPNVSRLFPNISEFNLSLPIENLTAGPNELEYLNGIPYPEGNKYHIHPEKGPMEGAFHKQSPHSLLRFIN